MIRVRYFAHFREQLDCEQEQIEFVTALETPAGLMRLLASRGGQWSEIFAGNLRVLVAINQDMVHLDSVIRDGDEVAFFPPVTGG